MKLSKARKVQRVMNKTNKLEDRIEGLDWSNICHTCEKCYENAKK